MRTRGWVLGLAVAVAVPTAGCSGGGGGSSGKKSEVTVSIDGADSESTSQTSGVDANGDTFVVITGNDFSIEIRFPGSGTGDFTSAASGGATMTFTDQNGDAFLSDDTTAGSSYEIHVTRNDPDGVEGTFTATVVGVGGATHSISANFVLVLGNGSGNNPYGGTYIGIFDIRGQVQTGTDPMTSEPIWGPLQIHSVRITLHFDFFVSTAEGAVYNIDEATVSDAFFGCQVGCTPSGLSFATLPQDPGTPTPNGPSSAGHGVMVEFPNGTLLQTVNSDGDLYTSTDGRVLSESLSAPEQPWLASDANSVFFDQLRFGEFFSSLKTDTRRAEWSLTRSAL